MPKKIVKLDGLTHEQWLTYRRQGIGGSDAATIVGKSPHSSLYTLWADKQGLLPETEDDEAMRTGRDLEQYVADRFCEATGKKVRRLPYMYRDTAYPFLIANIDRAIVGEKAGLECKTTSILNKTNFEGGYVQDHYICQCYHYMNVMDYEKMYLAVLVLGKGFYWYEIERNEAQQRALLKAEIDFWHDHIIGDKIPEADGSDSTAETLKQIYKGGGDEGISLVHIDKLLKEYAVVAAEVKNKTVEQDRLKQQIEAVLGENVSGEGTSYRVSWKPQGRVSVDTKLLKMNYPNVYEKVLKQTESRVFRFAERK